MFNFRTMRIHNCLQQKKNTRILSDGDGIRWVFLISKNSMCDEHHLLTCNCEHDISIERIKINRIKSRRVWDVYLRRYVPIIITTLRMKSFQFNFAVLSYCSSINQHSISIFHLFWITVETEWAKTKSWVQRTNGQMKSQSDNHICFMFEWIPFSFRCKRNVGRWSRGTKQC